MKYAIIAVLALTIGCSRTTFPEKIVVDVSIAQDGPAPLPPTPVPPGPSPSVFGLTDFVYNQVTGNVSDYDKASKARALGSRFRSISDGIPNTYTGVRPILSATLEATNSVIGQNNPAWTRATTAINQKIEELYRASRLRTDPQFKAAWLEIAAGMEMVR